MRHLHRHEKDLIRVQFTAVIRQLDHVAAELTDSIDEEARKITDEYQDVCGLRLDLLDLGDKYATLFKVEE